MYLVQNGLQCGIDAQAQFPPPPKESQEGKPLVDI